MKKISSLLVLVGTVATGALPTFASADHWHDRYHHRSVHDSGDGWRDLTILGGVAGLAGIATHNSTLTALGAAGAVYSGIRYENDRASRGRGYDSRRYDDPRWHDRRHDDRRWNHRGW